jgi:rhomboid protease GluP
MDIDQILFLIAILNLIGDLYNILKFKRLLPGWILRANVASLALCVAARLFIPWHPGAISLGILLAYVVAIRRFARRRAPLPKLPSPATKLLIAANIAAFLYQVHKNALDDPYELVMVGALYGPLLEDGEWWRLISAQFIHWGVAHISFNMLGLWFLGPQTENQLASLRFLVSYLTCGAGGMLVAWVCAAVFQQDSSVILLGASASVLGLVGLQAAFALKTYRHTGSLGAKAQLTAMTQIIILQAVFDFMVPEVSSTAHVGGAAVGFLMGMTMMRPRAVVGEIV